MCAKGEKNGDVGNITGKNKRVGMLFSLLCRGHHLNGWVYPSTNFCYQDYIVNRSEF